jgi:hypothetical protein
MTTRACPDWPELLDVAPELSFKHYTADELQLPHDVIVAVRGARLSQLAVCADAIRHVFNPAHTHPLLAGPLSESYWSDIETWIGQARSP